MIQKITDNIYYSKLSQQINLSRIWKAFIKLEGTTNIFYVLKSTIRKKGWYKNFFPKNTPRAYHPVRTNSIKSDGLPHDPSIAMKITGV